MLVGSGLKTEVIAFPDLPGVAARLRINLPVLLRLARAEIGPDLTAALERLHFAIDLIGVARVDEAVGSSMRVPPEYVFRAAVLEGFPREILARPKDAAVLLGLLLDGQGGAKSE